MANLDPANYAIALIAPLEIEARAAFCMLDRVHDGRFPTQRGDDSVYRAGEICGHSVVITTLPAGQEYGKGSTAALTSQVKKFFPNLRFVLLVGLAAGRPRLVGPSTRDIRLGDVLVSLLGGESTGLIEYGLGKETGLDGPKLLTSGLLVMTDPVVRAAIGSIKLQTPNDADLILPYYNEIKNERHSRGTFADPGQDADRLYSYDESGRSTIQIRESRPANRRTRIWYGPIGYGAKLTNNKSARDELRDQYNITGLEMEAVGTMSRIPVAIIRGVSHYADGHKNKEWQPYAAAMAAAYAKAMLKQILPPKDQDSGYASESRLPTSSAHSESVSEVATKPSTTEKHDGAVDLSDELQSLASDDDDIGSQVSAETTTEGMTGQALIRKFLCEEPQFGALCEKALTRLSRQRFVENMRRLLKSFHKSLLGEAQTEAERATAGLLRSRRGRSRISNQIASYMISEDENTNQAGLGIDLGSKQRVEMWMRGVVVNPKQELDTHDMGEESSTTSSDDEFPLISEAEVFLRGSTSFRRLQKELMLVFMPRTLRHVLLSIPRQQIWVSHEQDLTLSNRTKAWIEATTLLKWNWWPLSPRRRTLRHGEARVFWRCVSLTP